MLILFQVGTHVINSIHKFLYQPITRKDRETAERKRNTALVKQRLKQGTGNVDLDLEKFTVHITATASPYRQNIPDKINFMI